MSATTTPRIANPKTRTAARRLAGSILPGSLMVGAIVTGAALLPSTGAQAAVNTNSVAYWCGSSENGIKYEPVSDPFIVPAPPAGFDYTIAVVKAGSGPDENFVVQNPVAGDALSYPDDSPENRHVILCWTPVEQPPAPEEPPVEAPPADEPPADEPPVTEPPVTEPPVTDPPAAEPPVTPVVEPMAPPRSVAPPSEVASLAAMPEAAPEQPTPQLPATGSNGTLLAGVATALVAGGLAMRRLARRQA